MMKVASNDSCDILLCLIGLMTGVLCILMSCGKQDTRSHHAKSGNREAEWKVRWKTKAGNAFCEIILCFAILLLGYGLHARSPWGGEKGIVDYVAWTGFFIDVGLVGKTIWTLCGKERDLQKRSRVLEKEKELKESKRLEKLRKVEERKERRQRVTSTCRKWLQDVE
ncbi:hypothetical protein ONS95_005907 [Cadophora gregata]|uniref:uncharacterized protein n=1 Tax=Cadophora gregata TaxID=51156 RepID=UPI0026DC2C4E|nr:uncharacterized protein ONS95_005907 [Cadophora gregata]KAK0102285.1 hypothetical protein ONS95_005907 [Cadophora gregata]